MEVHLSKQKKRHTDMLQRLNMAVKYIVEFSELVSKLIVLDVDAQ
jgi:hypothetical protein